MFGFGKKITMDIVTYGDPLLKQKSALIAKVDEEILKIAENLVDAMIADDGVGLAAPQVGLSMRLVALSVPIPQDENGAPVFSSPGEALLLPKMPMVLVNPEIMSYGNVNDRREEGCLSVPNIYADVVRPATVVLRSLVLGGASSPPQVFTVECGGLLARALQHEIDHLDGVLFVDRLDSSERDKIKLKLEKLLASGKKNGFRKVIKIKK